MIVKRINLCALDTGSLTLGYVGENDHTQIRINCASVFADYPAAVVSMTVKAPSGVVYPREVETDGQIVIWTITDSDTASAGNGQIQLTFTEDGTIVKTVIAVTTVRASLVGDNPPPDPITDWIDEAGEALAKLEGITASATQLPAGDDPTAEVEIVDGHYNIALGLPDADAESIIDDNAGAGDVTKVWSANKSATELSELKSDLDSKAPVINRDASGDVVTFADGADGMPLSSCVVSVDPVQSGTGDPSPTNVRPISGHTGAQISRTGKNLCKQVIQGFPYTSNQTIYIDNETESAVFYAIAGQTYCRSASVAFNRNILAHVATSEITTGMPYTDIVNQSSGTGATWTATWTGWTVWYCSASKNTSIEESLQVELGSTASPYTPYTGQTYPISWQTAAGTVYGGNLTVHEDGTGTLIADKGYFTENGTANWQKNPSGSFYLIGQDTNVATNSNGLCNYSPYVYSTTAQYSIFARPQGQIAITYGWAEVWPTVDALKAAFAQTPLQVVYPLATPITYELTAEEVGQIILQSGEQNIWADTGAISLTYAADTKTYISEVTDPDSNIITVSGSTPSITGESGKRYICGTVDSISITPPSVGIIDVVFTSGTTPAVLTTSGVTWPSWFDSTSLNASTVYEINIQDGFGAVSKWT